MKEIIINRLSKPLLRLPADSLIEKRKKVISPHPHLAWAEIDLRAIEHNYRQIKRLLIKKSGSQEAAKILAVVKADAYGHGMAKVVSVLKNLDVAFFGVSDAIEGMALREQGIKQAILLLESSLPMFVPQIVDYDLTPTVCAWNFAKALNAYAQSTHKKTDVHIKVDTGMSRLGVNYEEAGEFIRRVQKLPQLSIRGIYTHFPIADTNPAFTRLQAQKIFELLKNWGPAAKSIEYIHASNSIGLAGYEAQSFDSSQKFNLARPGLMLYGLYPHPRLKKAIALRPSMQVKARVIFLKRIKKGQGISYGHTFVAKKDMTVATLPIGYSDGYMRCLSNKAEALIAGQRCPVVGRVTMDQTMVDVSHLKTIRLGMEAVLLGTQGKQTISADDLARQAGTISYEILCNLGNRLSREYC